MQGTTSKTCVLRYRAWIMVIVVVVVAAMVGSMLAGCALVGIEGDLANQACMNEVKAKRGRLPRGGPAEIKRDPIYCACMNERRQYQACSDRFIHPSWMPPPPLPPPLPGDEPQAPHPTQETK